MGDGVAGFFGIDQAREDDAERAIRAALEIRRGVEGYSHEVEAAWGISNFDVRIGVNTGRVAVGQVGAGDPQRVALGDAVNVAARLQSAARPGAVVVGASVAEAVGDKFVFRSLGPIDIRGRESQVQAFELEAEEALRIADTRTRLVGRTAELAQLSDAVRELCEGRGQLVTISGEGGLGKSRLLAELHSQIPPDVLWLEGYCDAMDDRLPHEPIAQILRMWLGVEGRASPIESRLRLRARAYELLGEQFDECAPYLARVLGVGLTTKLDHRLEGLPGDALAAGLRSAVALWLTTLGSQSPLVVAIDNFSAASQSTADLVTALLPTLEVAPIMLLVTMRPSANTPAQALHAAAVTTLEARARTVRLQPLNAEESSDLVLELGGRAQLDERLVDLVVERAEGNPLYIEELFAAIDGPSTDPRTSSPIPGPLEGVLLARLDALSASVRRVAQGAAVLGRSFMLDVLGQMLGDDEVKRAIPSLLRADVIRERTRVPRAYAFRHGLIREAALATLTEARLNELNELAAEALESWALFDVERDTAALAGHLLTCGRFSEALEHVDHLAERLAQVGRWSDAAELLEGCVRRVETVADTPTRVRTRLAELWSAQGRLDDALNILDEAIPLASVSQREELVLTKARCLSDAGRLDNAQEWLSGADDEIRSAAARTRLTILLGELALGRSDYAAAKEYTKSLGDVRALTPDLAFDAASLVAGVLASTGELVEAESWALYAHALADQAGQLQWQLSARRHVAVICLWKGCVEEAHHLVRWLYKEYKSLGLETGRLYAAVMLMHNCLLCGELEEGARVGEETLQGDVAGQWRALVCANLAAIRGEQGRFKEALELAQEVESAAEDLPIWARLSGPTIRAMAAMSRGDLDEAEHQFSTGIGVAAGEGFDAERALVIGNLAELALHAGNFGSALTLAEQALRTGVSEQPWGRLENERRYAHALSKRNSETAIQLLNRALESARAMGLALEEARALTSLGEVDEARRESHFAEAQAILEERGAGFALTQLRATRTRVGSSPRVQSNVV
jgi:tetratricopeptide (TPR) repeat protein